MRHLIGFITGPCNLRQLHLHKIINLTVVLEVKVSTLYVIFYGFIVRHCRKYLVAQGNPEKSNPEQKRDL